MRGFWETSTTTQEKLSQRKSYFLKGERCMYLYVIMINYVCCYAPLQLETLVGAGKAIKAGYFLVGDPSGCSTDIKSKHT